MNKKIITIIALGAVTMASCKKNDNSGPSQAHVMFVNACISSPNLSVYANNTAVQNAANLAFLKSSGYQGLTTGSVNMAFNLTSTNATLVSSTSNLAAGNNYSVFAGGVVNSPTILVTADDMTAPAGGDAKVRFINLNGSNAAENAYVGNTTIDSNAAANTASAYVNVPAGAANILIQNPTQPTQVVTLTNQQFSAGKIYTMVFTGVNGGIGDGAATLTIFNNN